MRVLIATSSVCFATLGVQAGSTAAVASSTPPCTKRALTAGLRASHSYARTGTIVSPTKCAGRFAFSAVFLDGNDVPQLFKAKHGRWVAVERTTYCNKGAVPRSIRQIACETS
jgi:hypothetical protein